MTTGLASFKASTSAYSTKIQALHSKVEHQFSNTYFYIQTRIFIILKIEQQYLNTVTKQTPMFFNTIVKCAIRVEIQTPMFFNTIVKCAIRVEIGLYFGSC